MSRKTLLIVLAVFFLVPSSLFAAGSIGTVAPVATSVDDSVLDLTPNLWLDQHFIVLEMPKSLQRFGYSGLATQESKYDHPSYKILAGKTLRVIKVDKEYMEYRVTFQETTTGKIYVTTTATYDGTLDSIALAKDLSRAKNRWFGKTIYAKKHFIRTYDQDSEQHGKIITSIGEPLKVIDIWWGFDGDSPLWIIVERSNGEKGYISTAYSWTNISRNLWTDNRPWAGDFFEENPRVLYDWSDEVWKAIDEKKIMQGMTKDQVILSWGNPKKVNKSSGSWGTKEQWVYGTGQYLYFEDGILTSWQSH